MHFVLQKGRGGRAWLNAPHSKCGMVIDHRGFESLPLRQPAYRFAVPSVGRPTRKIHGTFGWQAKLSTALLSIRSENQTTNPISEEEWGFYYLYQIG